MQSLAVGLIGCGNIAETYLSLAPGFSGLTIKAVADINADAASARAEEFAVKALSVDTLLQDESIDIVVNLTVPNAHYSVTRQILESGKHAWSEKPFVLSLSQAQELTRLASERDLRIGSAPDTFLGGSHQSARQAIEEGRIGQVIGGSCHFMSPGMESWHPNPDFFFLPGGGPVLDMGPYYLSNLIQMIGPVNSVCAMHSTGFRSRTIGSGPREGEALNVEVPTSYHALLQFVSGAAVTLSASWDVHAHRHSPMELYGTGGSLFIPDPNFFGGTVEISFGADETETLDNDNHPFAVPNSEDNAGVLQANYRCAGLADMAKAIQQSRPHRCSLALATHVMDVLLGIQQSAESRQWVALSTNCERPDALTAEQAAALLKEPQTTVSV